MLYYQPIIIIEHFFKKKKNVIKPTQYCIRYAAANFYAILVNRIVHNLYIICVAECGLITFSNQMLVNT